MKKNDREMTGVLYGGSTEILSQKEHYYNYYRATPRSRVTHALKIGFFDVVSLGQKQMFQASLSVPQETGIRLERGEYL